MRPLVDRATAEAWLRELVEPTTPRPPGDDLLVRRRRARRTIDSGSVEQQVRALAHFYCEAHRPDIEDLQALDGLERLVVVEIACVLGRDPEELRTSLRANRPRFSPDAPRSGEVLEKPAPAEHFGSFDVGFALHITDAADLALTLPAEAGAWIADFTPHEDALLVHHRDHKPATGEGSRALAEYKGTFNLAVMDDGAQEDRVIIDEMIDCEASDVCGRGVVWFDRADKTIRVWERDGRCYAVELRLHCDTDDDD